MKHLTDVIVDGALGIVVIQQTITRGLVGGSSGPHPDAIFHGKAAVAELVVRPVHDVSSVSI